MVEGKGSFSSGSRHMQRRLYLGFGALLILTACVVAVGLFRMSAMDNDLQHIVERVEQKTVNLQTMLNAVQQRRYSLFMISLMDDPFDIEEEWEQYNQAASDYLSARERLLQSGLDVTEKTQLHQLTLANQPLQNRTLSILRQQGYEAAREFLLQKARPGQQQVLDHLYQFYQQVRLKSAQTAHQMQRTNDLVFWITFFLGATVLLLGGLIAWMVAGRTLLQASEVEYQQRRFKALFDGSMDAVLLWNNMRLSECNPAAIALFGLDSGREAGLHLDAILPEHQEDGSYSRAMIGEQFHRASEGESTRFEFDFKQWNNRVLPTEVRLNQLMLDGQAIHQMVVRDISERRSAEQRIDYLAYHDHLTGLPNKPLLLDRLTLTIRQAALVNSKVAVLNINLRGFHHINESLGHESGDKVLLEIATRLSDLCREEDTLARLGADEFIFVRMLGEHIEVATQLAQNISTELAKLVALDNQNMKLGANIGIALFPDDGLTTVELLKNAESAMQRLRESGAGGYQLFTESMNAYALRRMKLQAGIQQGIEQQQFEVVYQPQQNISDKNLIGMEALLRWNHPQYGTLHPDEFIPLVEDAGLIEHLGRWVLQKACTDTCLLEKQGFRHLRVAVNLSSLQFRDTGLVEFIRHTLRETGLPGSSLELEITESTALFSEDKVLDIMNELREDGVGFAIDDFGTGYSSLSYLYKLPLDTLKIDRGFVEGVVDNREHAALVASVITLAHKLNMLVVAEGVETTAQLNFLRSQACDIVQGYYLGRPMSLSDFEGYLKSFAA
ncbi:MAG: EAL domain-containing protein [gamma proteobacterium symbiont of Bathyaustriella thionipta]|nr:EAL domain-containing protein [gamma proteobacterium symbiont of Bathyaustriella thionipta]